MWGPWPAMPPMNGMPPQPQPGWGAPPGQPAPPMAWPGYGYPAWSGYGPPPQMYGVPQGPPPPAPANQPPAPQQPQPPQPPPQQQPPQPQQPPPQQQQPVSTVVPQNYGPTPAYYGQPVQPPTNLPPTQPIQPVPVPPPQAVKQEITETYGQYNPPDLGAPGVYNQQSNSQSSSNGGYSSNPESNVYNGKPNGSDYYGNQFQYPTNMNGLRHTSNHHGDAQQAQFGTRSASGYHPYRRS